MVESAVRPGFSPGFLSASGATPSGGFTGFLRQSRFGDDQVGQGEERVELRRVLGQTSVAHLAMTKEVFDDVKGMLHVSAQLRFAFLQGFGDLLARTFRHGLELAALGRHLPLDVRELGHDLGALFHAGVARVALAAFLLPVE